jgi:cytochrome c556
MRPVHARMFALGPLALAACVTPAATQEVRTLDVRHVMQAEINPAIVAIWDVGNNASDDEGMLDAARMTPESWAALATAAAELAATGDRMAAATEIRAASPGNMATEDYEVTMVQVQSYINADPQGFRDLSARFAGLARQLEAAAQGRDAAAAGALVARMDTECTICHARYWYAEAQ